MDGFPRRNMEEYGGGMFRKVSVAFLKAIVNAARGRRLDQDQGTRTFVPACDGLLPLPGTIFGE